jgi:hypothetical protein
VKGDWLFITLLFLVATVFPAALGVDWVLWLTRVLARWLTAWPPPDEHFASMVAGLGWPLTALLIVWLFRRPLKRATYLLSERMKRDNLKIAGFLEITATEFNTMDPQAAVEHVQAAPAVAQAVDVAESLLEYAGVSDTNAARLLRWIEVNYGTAVDPEAFLTEPEFADARQRAYTEFIEGLGE